MEKKSRFLLKKNDWLALSSLLLLAVFLLILGRFCAAKEKNIAVVTLNGNEILRLDLEEEEDRIISLQEEYGVPVSFQIENHRIRFVNVTCPDHICEKSGYLWMEGQIAVCMPNRTTLSVYGDEA